MKYLKSNPFNVDAVYELLQVKSPAEHSKMKVALSCIIFCIFRLLNFNT